MIELIGSIKSVLFYSETSFYIVCRVQVEDEIIAMTGKMSNYNEYDTYKFTGDYTVHPKYGKQFAFQEYEIIPTTNEEDLINYLSSPLFSGIGKKLAEAIVEILGEDCIEKIKEDPSILYQVPKITKTKQDTIYEVLTSQQEDYEVMRFFMKSGISMKNIGIIQAYYKEKTLQVLENNPYQLIDDIEGIGFKTMDEVAHKIGIDEADERRIKAYIIHLIKEYCFQSGSTYITIELLQTQLFKTMNSLTSDEFNDFVEQLITSGKLVEEQGKYYTYDMYDAEATISSFIHKLLNRNDLFYNDEAHEYLEALEKENDITYAKKQKEAIYAFLESSAMILTGGPGTGKSTIVKAIVTLYKQLYPHHSVALLAPTGKAAKRLSELTGQEAQTIHRLLKWDLEANKFGMNESNPINHHVLIIDEASMVDCLLLSNLIKASKDVLKILFIGDYHQLPSVSPGNILHDLIDDIVPTIRLEEIFRQESGSGIVDFCDKVIHESIDELSFLQQYNDIHFYPCVGDDVISNVSLIVKKAMEQGYPIHDIQILSPMYQGSGGINEFNRVLQDIMNPSDDWSVSYQVGQKTYREGDKILQLKNRPEDDVYNGDIGILVEINKKDGINHLQDNFIVDFDGKFVSYTNNDFHTISHAYCMSIHKSQGSEFKIVILVLLNSHYMMLKRNLVYTAISRAKHRLFLLGQPDAYVRAIKNVHDNNRLTTLKERFIKEENISPYDFLD